MKLSVFEYREYVKFIESWIADQRAHAKRGVKSKMAKAMGCHSAYVSLVLSRKAHLSAEQALLLSQEMNLSVDESEYFLLLVHIARAGTKSLRDFYFLQLDKLQQRRQVLKERFKASPTLSNEDQVIYYSSWLYGAVHVLISIPHFQEDSVERLSEALNVSGKKISDILNFLETRKVITNKEGVRSVGSTAIHLGSDSPLISKHHQNWRSRCLQSLDDPSAFDLHYSSAISLGHDDVPAVREILVKTIEQIRTKVKSAKDEAAYCYLLDLFPISIKNSPIK